MRSLLPLLLVAGCFPDFPDPPDTDQAGDTDTDVDTDTDTDVDTDADVDTDTDVSDRDGDGSPDDEDCAPDDGSVYPGAPETCEDGTDQDCDGVDDACLDEGSHLVTDRTVHSTLGGILVGRGGDVDGDGLDEIVVGSISQAWSVLEHVGSTLVPIDAGTHSALTPPMFTMVGSGQDIDGDGSDDLIFGSWIEGPGGLVSVRLSGDPGNLATWGPPQTGPDQIGLDVALIPDADGDGIPDAVACAAQLSGPGYAEAGAAVLLSAQLTPGTNGRLLTDADLLLTVPLMGGSRDACTVSGGDVTGDGRAEILFGNGGLGDPDPQSVWVYELDSARGVIPLEQSGDTRFRQYSDTPTAQLPGQLPPLAATVEPADIDGDGTDDLVVGFPYDADGAGRVIVTQGGSTLAQGTEVQLGTIDGPENISLFAASIAVLQTDGGTPLVAVAASAHEVAGGPPAEGRVLLFDGAELTGGAVLDDTDFLVELRGVQGSDAHKELGWILDSAGDTNGDGYDDLVISESPYATQQSVHLLLGGIPTP